MAAIAGAGSDGDATVAVGKERSAAPTDGRTGGDIPPVMLLGLEAGIAEEGGQGLGRQAVTPAVAPLQIGGAGECARRRLRRERGKVGVIGPLFMYDLFQTIRYAGRAQRRDTDLRNAVISALEERDSRRGDGNADRDGRAGRFNAVAAGPSRRRRAGRNAEGGDRRDSQCTIHGSEPRSPGKHYAGRDEESRNQRGLAITGKPLEIARQYGPWGRSGFARPIRHVALPLRPRTIEIRQLLTVLKRVMRMLRR